jgi:hypothetical protein
VEKVQTQINIWSRFNLSLSGRINIAKTMMYSQLNYNGCFLPLELNKLTNLEEKIVRFVTGKLRIAQERVFMPIKMGGLGLFPVREFLGAQKCSWILRARSNDEVWKIDFNKNFNNDLELIKSNIIENTDSNMFFDWAKNWELFYEKFSMTNYLNVKVIDNKVLTLNLRTKKFLTLDQLDAGFPNELVPALVNTKLRDLTNIDGQVKSHEHFCRATNLPVSLRLFAVLKKILETAQTRFEASGSDTLSTFFRSWKKGSSKIRKTMCLKKVQKQIPHNIVKLADTCEVIINYDTSLIVNSHWSNNFYSPAQKAFVFKFTNNILGTNTRVSHFNRNIDRNCEFCNLTENPDPEDESIVHLFFDCTTTEALRVRFFTKIFGRDLTRQEFFVSANNDTFSKMYILKVITILFMFFIWESKKRFCLPSYTLLNQYIKMEIETFAQYSQKFKKILQNSDIRL